MGLGFIAPPLLLEVSTETKLEGVAPCPHCPATVKLARTRSVSLLLREGSNFLDFLPSKWKSLFLSGLFYSIPPQSQFRQSPMLSHGRAAKSSGIVLEPSRAEISDLTLPNYTDLANYGAFLSLFILNMGVVIGLS